MEDKRDMVIIGGGPGGYVAALRAAQLKRNVLLVEEDRVGGTCMNYGCIPTKYLLTETKIYKEIKENKKCVGLPRDIAYDWKKVQEGKRGVVSRLVKGVEFLLQKNGIELIKGTAALLEGKCVSVKTANEERLFETENIILATGSQASILPFLKPNGREVITSREALELEEIPRKMIVVGAGAIGLEIGLIFGRMGAEVTILEIMPAILPGSDVQLATRLERILKRQGVNISTDMGIEEASIEKGRVILKGKCLRTKSPFALDADVVLIATGRKPNSEALEKAGISLSPSGNVVVNSKLETNIAGVYAIGDLIGGKLLAHKASHEGIMAAENACGAAKEMEYAALPMAVFSEPEFASVGMTEEEARGQNLKVQVGLFSLQANGRALTMEKPEGIVKVIAAEDDRIIGAHILAPNASELLGELILAIRHRLKVQDISSSFHIHPTLSEAVMEAALKAKGMAIHALNE